MRVVVTFAILTGCMMGFGWPSPWVLVCSAFAAGFLSRTPRHTLYRPERGRDRRRPGYVKPPVSRNGNPGTAERVATYTGSWPVGTPQVAAEMWGKQAALSSNTEPTGSTDGRSETTGTAGYPGPPAENAGSAPEPGTWDALYDPYPPDRKDAA